MSIDMSRPLVRCGLPGLRSFPPRLVSPISLPLPPCLCGLHDESGCSISELCLTVPVRCTTELSLDRVAGLVVERGGCRCIPLPLC